MTFSTFYSHFTRSHASSFYYQILSSWLGPLLRARQVSEQHISLCEEALVQNEGFTDAKLFFSLREPDLAAYLSHIGIVQKGVQMKVVALHKLLQLSQELCGGNN